MKPHLSPASPTVLGQMALSFFALVGLAGCHPKSQTQYEGNISVTDMHPEPPEFRRKYKTVVGDGFVVEVELRSWSLGRLDSSTLTQKNGKYIFFDADRVADKIIDRELYPLVQAAVDEILILDRKFIASNPSEFTDEKGAVWRKVR